MSDTETGAVSDAASTADDLNGPNGAGTAVGVPHPENRHPHRIADGIDTSRLTGPEYELSDYDTETPAEDLPESRAGVGQTFSDDVVESTEDDPGK